jgi:hypothetical protein
MWHRAPLDPARDCLFLHFLKVFLWLYVWALFFDGNADYLVSGTFVSTPFLAFVLPHEQLWRL